MRRDNDRGRKDRLTIWRVNRHVMLAVLMPQGRRAAGLMNVCPVRLRRLQKNLVQNVAPEGSPASLPSGHWRIYDPLSGKKSYAAHAGACALAPFLIDLEVFKNRDCRR